MRVLGPTTQRNAQRPCRRRFRDALRGWTGEEPGDDLLSALTGVGLTRRESIDFAMLLVMAGTETVGRLPEKQARSFVSTIRRKMDSCSDRELGTEVVTAASRSSAKEELAVWHVTVEVTENRSVKYFMAVARTGGQLLQLGFIPAPGVEMDRGAFLALAERGLERLRSGS